MTLSQYIRSGIELIGLIFTVWALFNEDKLLTVEEHIKSLLMVFRAKIINIFKEV